MNPYSDTRFATSSDARDNRHVPFVREFASVVSIFQASTISAFGWGAVYLSVDLVG
jgi:hypothetical protein